jgi:pimeloyl-ACP methyl ester carboxylesterase
MAMMTLPTRCINGIRLFDSGPAVAPAVDRRPFLLLHGLGASLNFWVAVAPRLAAQRRTVAIDLPGFGLSRLESEDFSLDAIVSGIATFMRSLGMADLVVVGHSLGGPVALRLAARYPGIVKTVILVDGTLLSVQQVLTSPLYAVRHPVLAAMVAAQFIGAITPITPIITEGLLRSALGRRASLWPFVAHPAEVDRRRLVAALKHTGGNNVLKVISAIQGVRIEQLMAEVGQQTHLIWGELDKLIPQRDVDRSIELLNVGSLHRVSDCGHWPMIEYPQTMTALLLRVAQDSSV